MAEQTAPAPTVLVVDPDDDARAATGRAVGEVLPEPRVHEAGSLAAATDRLADLAGEAADEHVDAVVTEYDLGDGTGLELAARVRERAPDAGCILYTATEEIETDSFEETVVAHVQKTGSDADATQFAAALEAATAEHSHAAYPLPADEAGRLAALEAYVEGDAPERVHDALDRVVSLAADHFGVEVASINLIEEHEQAFLAVRGRDWAPMPRELSICTYTILEERTMTVADTAEDPRFADNEILEAEGIRAYIGATLRTPGGHSIGTLCVYDDEPREFSAADEAYLVTLADLAMDVLALATVERGEGGT